MPHLIDPLPKTMLAIEIIEPGGPEKLSPTQLPLIKPPKSHLLVKVAAAGVNRPDIFQRMGVYPPSTDASPIPGLEIAGQVVSVGEGCQRWKKGDKVCALVAGGGYAEYCLVHEAIALPVGDLSYIEAAALPENFFTVWANVFQIGQLKKNETVLVHGGTSGIGSVTIMLAKIFGAKVFTTVGSVEKMKVASSLGTDKVINYMTEDFAEKIVEYTQNKGVDMVVDLIGGDYVNKNYQIAAKLGRIIQVGMMRGAPQQLNLMPLMVKQLVHTGSTMRARTLAEKIAIATALENKVWPLINSGKIKPIIAKTYPLEQAEKAHRFMESGALIGKLVLVNEHF